MNVVFINLKDRTDRRERMEARLVYQGFCNVLRLEATTPEQVKTTKKELGLKNRSNLNNNQLACYLSHYRAIQHITEPTLILEDDAEFVPGFKERLKALDIEKTPYDIIHFGLYPEHKKFHPGMYRQQTEWLAHAYLVHPKRKEMLLSRLSVITRAIDHALFMLQNELIIYDIRPSLIVQDGSKSSIKM